MINEVILIGRITKDIEVRYTQSNRACASFTIAIPRGYKNANGEYESDFINIVVWDKLGETVGKYSKKGDLIAINGRLQVRSYENKDGKKVYVTEVVANKINFLTQKKKDNDPFENKTSFKAEEIDEDNFPFE